MKHQLPIIFALGTALCWGLYGPTLQHARAPGSPPSPPPEGWSPFKPYVGIGLAYLVLAIIGGLIMMKIKGDTFSFSGKQWSKCHKFREYTSYCPNINFF